MNTPAIDIVFRALTLSNTIYQKNNCQCLNHVNSFDCNMVFLKVNVTISTIN